VNPTLPDQVVSPVNFSTSPNINCDMLNDGMGNFIKAIAWDEGVGTFNTHLYFEDGFGHTAQYTLPALLPDIVLGNVRGGTDIPTEYRAAVVAIAANSIPTIWFFTMKGMGTPGFTIYPTGSFSLTTTKVGTIYNLSPVLPHIDMWSDANNKVNGLPGMYQFAVSWVEPSVNAVKYNVGDITSGTLNNPIGGKNVNLGVGNIWCDVACYTNVQTGSRYATFCSQDLGTPLPLAAYTFDFSSGPVGVPISKNSFVSPFVFCPRIEAMSQYDPTFVAYPWQIICSQQDSVTTYNAGGTTNINKTLIPVGNFKSPAIAAGVGMPFLKAIGNVQFTQGYLNIHGSPVSANYYARITNAATGTVTDPDYYIINTNPAYTPGITFSPADASSALALSNCSNSGDMLLSVWFDAQAGSPTGDIMYKLSGNSVPVKFRPTAIATLQGEKPTLYPNPATDHVNLPNEEGEFQIINSLGAKVAEGQLQQDGGVNVQNLPAGVYLLRTHSHTYPFTKL
ncbi:MAG: T9SS type A sorting domain-containing protein, partial [Bacteroidetes bacterium]|nr:T9SS type A sorting domain-containing protein [Bacteroidota bacterium]